uniref:Sphingosine kinase putative n=1 Tax=Albugo laibachii Nc14 TaxID=890382 RepID=F0WD65_9STRA|nr:sphingosine kinase putative [Albugo laibachii Nc14]|eukprot:CCA19137.1 sphingosine kinase putative [Albugo laibachii Nc14]
MHLSIIILLVILVPPPRTATKMVLSFTQETLTFSNALNVDRSRKEEKESPILNERMVHSSLGESQSNSSSCRSFEANAAKEAQELAEFETLERDLANEKLLYNIENEQETSNWHWQDLDELSDAARQSANAEESEEPHFTEKASCSELSALSLDDSEPWVGNTTLGQQSLQSDSSIRMSTIEWHRISEKKDTADTHLNDTIEAFGTTDGSFQSNLDQAIALKSLKQRLNENSSRPQRKNKVAPTLTKQDIPVETPDEKEPSAPADANQDLPTVLQQKLRELDHEVQAYQRLSSQVKMEVASNRQEWQALKAAKENFEQHCEKETARMKQHMQQEHTRLEKEAIAHERQWKARLQAAHCTHEKNKETRSQVETLRAQIVKMQLEERQQRQKYKANTEVLRQRVKELETQLQEMREEVRYLEKVRLQHWSCGNKRLSSRGAIKKKGRRRDQHTPQNESSLPTICDKHDKLNGNVLPPATPADTILDQPQQDYDPNRYDPIRSPTTAQEKSEPFESSRSTTTASASASSTPTSEPSKGTKDSPEHCFFQNDVLRGDKHKKQIVHSDQTKEIVYPDGNRKRINADGSIHIQFINGDTKDLDPQSGKSIYYYAEAQTKLTTFADQTKVYEFPNHQIETNYPNGRTEIQFPDGIFKCIETDGMEVSTFPDGTQMIERPNGVREIKLTNGQLLRYDANGSMTWLDSTGNQVGVDREQEIQFGFQAGESQVGSQ